jgi:hypothetical protein
MPIQRKPSIVFVHGLWADGSCFSKLIPTLWRTSFNPHRDWQLGSMVSLMEETWRRSSPTLTHGRVRAPSPKPADQVELEPG